MAFAVHGKVSIYALVSILLVECPSYLCSPCCCRSDALALIGLSVCREAFVLFIVYALVDVCELLSGLLCLARLSLVSQQSFFLCGDKLLAASSFLLRPGVLFLGRGKLYLPTEPSPPFCPSSFATFSSWLRDSSCCSLRPCSCVQQVYFCPP